MHDEITDPLLRDCPADKNTARAPLAHLAARIPSRG